MKFFVYTFTWRYSTVPFITRVVNRFESDAQHYFYAANIPIGMSQTVEFR